MKKLLCMILALIMVMSLCACGNEPSDNGQDNSSVNGTGTNQNPSADTDSGTEENVDPNKEAVKAVLIGTWLPANYDEDKENAEILKFHEDGTVEMLGTTYTWKLHHALTEDSGRIDLYDGDICFYHVKYSVKENGCNYLSFDSVRGVDSKYKLATTGYFREADYQIVEITMENFEEYFEIVEHAKVTKDAFGDATKIEIYPGIAFKEGHGEVNLTISQCAIEYSYHMSSKYNVTPDKTTGEYKYEEKVHDGNLHTKISDCQMQGNLGGRYGVVACYACINNFPSDTISVDDEITVTRVIGTLFIYTPAE